jgi:crotonobetainyl-CoA:carnitine CoA-transferase CaiB-like acyl-CoA transferase
VLHGANPAHVICRITGYGQTGPYRDRPGFARIAHAVGGLTHLAGMPDGPPVTPGSSSLADYFSGMYGVVGIMMAQRVAESTGRGQVIDVALYESIFRILDEVAPAYQREGIVRGREGRLTRQVCPHGHFECGDGRWVAIACTNDRMFERLAHTMGRPDFAAPDRYGTTAARLRDSAVVDALVKEWVGGMKADTIVALCAETDVPCASVNTIADIMDEAHFTARDNHLSLAHAVLGEIAVPGVVPRLSETPGEIRSLGPELGASNQEILSGLLGMDSKRIDALKLAGII